VTGVTQQDPKQEQLEKSRVHPEGTYLTTQQGVRVDHTDDALTLGERGPTLLEDFHAREKITHFDHERIPERVVHARGSGAYGYFEPYDRTLAPYTVAEFLTDPDVRTPVFVRFSTVVGFRGSADTVRDVRGFAVKFYTRQGNYDLVGNNMPVFFIQDGIKFPDFVHAIKPEQHNEIPQAQSAHDTFWDFVAQQPETMHMVMWLMSDRALPRSYRMMQGFGVHTFRLVNGEGRGTFVKFHWKPKLCGHSLLWEEMQQVAGKDPDYNRRDLWEAIEAGNYPEWELGVQLVPEEDESTFGFDLLDATKLIPEEEVPVQPVGRLVLNRNPGNFFAETEQVAFHTANLVPGIDFTNDPLLQFRNFSYLDTQLIRLGGPNFAQIPINRPVVPVTTNQREGFHQGQIHVGRGSYHKNTLAGGCPAVDPGAAGVFSHYAEKVEGHKIRKRSQSFQDYYSQATLFWNSMSGPEREHIVSAFRFELGKCDFREVRQAVVAQLNRVDHDLAVAVARGIGARPPEAGEVPNHGRSSAALSQLNLSGGSAATRKVAVLAADGVDGAGVRRLTDGLREAGVIPEVLGPAGGLLRTASGDDLEADRAIPTMASVLYDAVVVPCGPDSVAALRQDGYAVHFVSEAFRHQKPIGAFGAGVELLQAAGLNGTRLSAAGDGVIADHGVVTTGAAADTLPAQFWHDLVRSLAAHRAWDRDTRSVAA
jgi:catalase